MFNPAAPQLQRKQLQNSNPTTLEPSNPETCNPGTLKPYDPRTLKPGKFFQNLQRLTPTKFKPRKNSKTEIPEPLKSEKCGFRNLLGV